MGPDAPPRCGDLDLQRRALIVLGGGGHARMLVEIIRLRGGRVAGLVGPGDERIEVEGRTIGSVGRDADLPRLFEEGFRSACLGVGTISASDVRRRLHALCVKIGFELPRLVHPSAVVSTGSVLETGVQILPGAVVNTGARLAESVIVNSGSVVEHDCTIGAFAHVATGAVLCGDVEVGPGAHVGAGAVVRQGCRIGPGATVGAGAVVVSEVPGGTTVVGVPARPLAEG